MEIVLEAEEVEKLIRSALEREGIRTTGWTMKIRCNHKLETVRIVFEHRSDKCLLSK